MYRNQYDTDVTIWSPEGRLYQVEYAMQAVRQGSACAGMCSKDFVVLSSLKRKASELASHQQKIFRVDDHMGIAIAGLTADARVLCRYMQNECLNHKYAYESPMQCGRLVAAVADKHQSCTQTYVRRPYGVGLLVAGYDQTGPHLYQTSPSGSFFEYKAFAIGNRSQSAKTYLTKRFAKDEATGQAGFEDLGADELIDHSIKALRGCTQGDQELTQENVSISIVGKGRKFEIIEGDKLAPFLAKALAEDGGEAKTGEAMDTTA